MMPFILNQIREAPNGTKWTIIDLDCCGDAEVKNDAGTKKRVPLRVLRTWRVCDPDPVRDYAQKYGYVLPEGWP